MPVTADITATYRGPGRVAGRLLDGGRQELRVLSFAMLAGLLIFIAQAPFQAREAHLDPSGPLAVRLYWSAFLCIFLLPLLLYALAALVWLVSRIAGRRISGFACRLTLVWAVLATAPVILLAGMIAAFTGPGAGLRAVGFVWLALFLWFWFSGLLRADGGGR